MVRAHGIVCRGLVSGVGGFRRDGFERRSPAAYTHTDLEETSFLALGDAKSTISPTELVALPKVSMIFHVWNLTSHMSQGARCAENVPKKTAIGPIGHPSNLAQTHQFCGAFTPRAKPHEKIS